MKSGVKSGTFVNNIKNPTFEVRNVKQHFENKILACMKKRLFWFLFNVYYNEAKNIVDFLQSRAPNVLIDGIRC